MLEPKILQRALIVGTGLQITWIFIRHFVPWMMETVFLFGGMMISGIAGYLYAMDYGAGFGPGIMGGAIAGGACMLIGTAAAVLLGDVPAAKLALYPAISVLTGIAGGFWGEVAARMTRPRR